MNKIQCAYGKFKGNLLKLSIFLYTSLFMLLTAASPAYADKIADATSGAANGFWESAKGAVKYLLIIVCIVIGIVFIVGTSRQKENQKEGIWEKLIGVGIVVCAPAIAAIVFGWF